MKSGFFDLFSKNTKISRLMKLRPVGCDLFHADGRAGGRTDRHDEANSSFSQFCESAKKNSAFSPQDIFYSRFCAFRAILTVNNINPLVCD
jgi:hypothetical protein